MFEVIYDPSIINSLIKKTYCEFGELIDKNSDLNNDVNICYFSFPYDYHIPIIPLCDKDKIFCIYHVNNKWIFKHSNFNWSNDYVTDLLINQFKTNNINNKYYGVIVNSYIKITHYIDKNNVIKANWWSYQILDLYNCQCRIFDIIVASQNGYIHLNSSSFSDIIISTICRGKTNSQINTRNLIEDLFSNEYYPNVEPAIQEFINKFKSVQKNKPTTEYSDIYQFYNIYDNIYFDKKMKTFQLEILQMFKDIDVISRIDFIIKFIDCLKKDLALEILFLYNRLRNYAQERLALYKKYPTHPYVIIVKMFNQYVKSSNNNKATLDMVYNFINDDKNLPQLLFAAIKDRSTIFNFMYNQYLITKNNNIKPKYKSHNYFPMKVFSATLFMVDHMSIEVD